MLEIGRYRIADPDAIATPALVLFEELVDHNIRTVCELAGGADNLFAHAKTHKSDAVTRKHIEQGIDSFKLATLNEMQMVLRAGAKRAILAYPQIQPGSRATGSWSRAARSPGSCCRAASTPRRSVRPAGP